MARYSHSRSYLHHHCSEASHAHPGQQSSYGSVIVHGLLTHPRRLKTDSRLASAPKVAPQQPHRTPSSSFCHSCLRSNFYLYRQKGRQSRPMCANHATRGCQVGTLGPPKGLPGSFLSACDAVVAGLMLFVEHSHQKSAYWSAVCYYSA